MDYIGGLLVAFLIGTIHGLILHEKLFPENKTINEISKIKNSTIENLSVGTPEPQQKKKGFLRRIFKRNKTL